MAVRSAGLLKDVQRCLANCGDSDVAEVGSDLGDLHSRRIQADYRLDKPQTEHPATATAIVVEAKEMIETLDRAFGGPSLVPIAAAIRLYWRTVLGKPL